MRGTLLTLSWLWRAHRGTFAIAVTGALLTLAAVQLERQREAKAFSSELALRAQDESARLQRSVDSAVEALQSIASLYASSSRVDRPEFVEFTRRAIQHHTEILALEWAPRVTHAQRRAFESELGSVIPGRSITELGLGGQLVSAPEREEYFPVSYIHPAQGNERAFGFDLLSRVGASMLLEDARVEAKAVVSPLVTLVQGGNALRAVLMFQPIYRSGSAPAAAEARRQELFGFAVALLSPQELMEKSVRDFRPTGLDVMLIDSEAAGPERVLYFHPSRSRPEPIGAPSIEEMRSASLHQMTIRVPDGQWLMLFRPAPAFLAEHHSDAASWILLGGFALTGLATFSFARRARYLSEIFKLAQHDALTGLPNRVLFADRLDQALAHAERERLQLAVFFLDLDRFKHINDSLGHSVGDRILQEVSRRLQMAIRKGDTVARMGGDEFIILMPELRQVEDAAHMAEHLLAAFSEPLEIDRRVFYLSASIGVSVYPRDAAQADALVANADAAMYRAKNRGRNQYEFYSEELTAAARERLDLESDLRQALRDDLLEVHYQPQVNLLTGRTVGAEALCRWNHPARGYVSPAIFIPIAEDAGLIAQLGEVVLRQACQQARRWLDSGFELENMAVNVAGHQIQRDDFVETVRQVLEECGLPPERLELEVTEGFLMEQAESSIDTLIELSRLGVTLSIDDFGTGYSSLAYLKRLPIHKLKVDQSFVRDLPEDEEDVAITRAIIALAKSLMLPVVAEGVETEGQQVFLQMLGCEQAQGYLYSRPVPAEDFPLHMIYPCHETGMARTPKNQVEGQG